MNKRYDARTYSLQSTLLGIGIFAFSVTALQDWAGRDAYLKRAYASCVDASPNIMKVITNLKTLRRMQSAGWVVMFNRPVSYLTGSSKRIPRYVDNGPNLTASRVCYVDTRNYKIDTDYFVYSGRYYTLKYNDGCFYPFVTSRNREVK